MPRFSNDQILAKALDALDDVRQRALKEAVPKTPELRFLLAFLANNASDRAFFDEFWRAATKGPAGNGGDSISFGRRQSLNGCHKGIYRSLGFEPPG